MSNQSVHGRGGYSFPHDDGPETDSLAYNPNDAPYDAILRAARACGISDNGDTCGVCRKHFHECEEDLATHEDPPFTRDKMWFACPGARMRQALARFGILPR